MITDQPHAIWKHFGRRLLWRSRPRLNPLTRSFSAPPVSFRSQPNSHNILIWSPSWRSDQPKYSLPPFISGKCTNKENCIHWFAFCVDSRGDSITGLSLISLNLDFFLTHRVSFETWDHNCWSIGCVAFLFLAWLVTRPDSMFSICLCLRWQGTMGIYLLDDIDIKQIKYDLAGI